MDRRTDGRTDEFDSNTALHYVHHAVKIRGRCPLKKRLTSVATDLIKTVEMKSIEQLFGGMTERKNLGGSDDAECQKADQCRLNPGGGGESVACLSDIPI